MLKKIFHAKIHLPYVDAWLLVLRICIGAFLLTHGYPKFQKLMAGGEIKFADPIGIGVVPTLVLVVFAEFFCSILLIIGLGGRFAALVLIINMSVAAFIALNGQPFNKMELPLLYLLIFITLFVTGPGKYSVDGWIGRK